MAGKESLCIEQPVHVCQLSVGDVFGRLTPKEKLYAHHMARAAWHGTRIILRQVSPESGLLFDFILSLYQSCNGNWASLAAETGVLLIDMRRFLEYAAVFLANIGNYFGQGDQKFNPSLTKIFLEKVSSISSLVTKLYRQLADSILAEKPSSLGLPSDVSQSSYYPGDLRITGEEIAAVSKTLQENSIYLENTRIRKTMLGDRVVFDVLQGSAIADGDHKELRGPNSMMIRVIRGDHSQELGLICDSLGEAQRYAANSCQERLISEYQDSFRSGDIEKHKQAQKSWVQDLKPTVETILGFVEPYRDPFGARAEFEGLVAIVDSEESKTLTSFVSESTRFIRRLPWTQGTHENNGKGPFERDLFVLPDFTSVYALAYCSSTIFLGINLPNVSIGESDERICELIGKQYNDIRQTVGSKNIIISNHSSSISERDVPPFIELSESLPFIKHALPSWKIHTTIHELLGHGTGKLLMQSGPTEYNFDVQNPPINPLTRKPITEWYRPRETWNSVFGGIAASLDECRADCVGSYLITDKELLAIFGFTDHSDVTADDLIYNFYLQLGVRGLYSLESYDLKHDRWGQAHYRGQFAIFRSLLSAGDGFMTVESDPLANKLIVRIDRSKILSHGKPAIGDLLLKLHIYRCTADVKTCRAFYEDLTRPADVFLEWRRIVLANKRPKKLFVQANTFLEDGQVRLKEYEESFEGLIQSWAERAV